MKKKGLLFITLMITLLVLTGCQSEADKVSHNLSRSGQLQCCKTTHSN